MASLWFELQLRELNNFIQEFLFWYEHNFAFDEEQSQEKIPILLEDKSSVICYLFWLLISVIKVFFKKTTFYFLFQFPIFSLQTFFYYFYMYLWQRNQAKLSKFPTTMLFSEFQMCQILIPPRFFCTLEVYLFLIFLPEAFAVSFSLLYNINLTGFFQVFQFSLLFMK